MDSPRRWLQTHLRTAAAAMEDEFLKRKQFRFPPDRLPLSWPANHCTSLPNPGPRPRLRPLPATKQKARVT